MKRLVATALAALAGITACRKSTGSADFPNLQILARYPVTGQFQDIASVCEGAEAMLIAFDTGGGRDFEYRLLFDTTGAQLWGCGGEICDGPIDGEIPLPKRVMIEGITVPPQEYGVRRHDVACRGIADTSTGMGSIVQAPLAFPGLEDAIHAEVPMLRVGAFNGMFTDAGPAAFGMTGGLLVAPEDREDVLGDLRLSTGGIVVAAGGSDPLDGNRAFDGVYEFHPWKIAFERTATMSTSHTYGAAEPFVNEDGDPEMLFVGGIGTNALAVVRSDVYRRGKATTESYAQSSERYFPGVSRMEMDGGRAIAVLNGCWGATGAHTAYQHDYEVFYPDGAPAGCPNAGQRGFCTPNTSASGISVEGRCQAAIATLDDGRLWFATGLRDDNVMSDYTYVFDGELAGGTFEQLPLLIPEPVRLPATVPLGDDRFAIFGGFTSFGTTATDHWSVIHPVAGSIAQGLLLEPRGHLTATMLLDGRILITGGFNGVAWLDSAEIIERGNDETGGQAERIVPAGKVTCTPGADCERMSAVKYPHFATRIEGSATWLEGAVLLGGGASNAAGTSEIFVPAYHCEGSRPVNRLDGERVPHVELCDRLRDPPPINDPRNLKKL